MNDRTVTNRNVITDFERKVVGQVSDDAVLQIRALPDRDEIDIAPSEPSHTKRCSRHQA